MITLFETLAICHGQIQNIAYHNQRFIDGQLFLGRQMIVDDIASLIQMPDNCHQKLMRCRVTYNRYDVFVDYFLYTPKTIQSFKIIVCDDIDYAYKYDDRHLINRLLAKKGDCDEIIIVKKGMITDCAIGNLLFLKNQQWYTPDTPLLCGTQRQYLLDKQQIHLATIAEKTLFDYEKVMMINALNPFDDRRAVAMACIHP